MSTARQVLEAAEGGEYAFAGYECIADLLADLGLAGALPELAERALASSDPAVRRTGEALRNELLPQPGEG
jgi:hypothetical protein